MKKLLPLSVLLATVGLTATLCAQTAPKTDREKLGYSLGVDVAQTLKAQPIDLDQAQFASGFHDVFSAAKLQLTDDQVKEVLNNFSRDLQAKKQASARAGGDKNRQAGTAFLAANKTKPGVQTLPDGLQYKVVQEGTGPLPKPTDKVTVKYRGTTIEGVEFDSSEHQPGGAVAFGVSEVIKGWTEALLKMKVGSKWQLSIPADLAYGDMAPPGAAFGPGSTLLFDVELVGIAK